MTESIGDNEEEQEFFFTLRICQLSNKKTIIDVVEDGQYEILFSVEILHIEAQPAFGFSCVVRKFHEFIRAGFFEAVKDPELISALEISQSEFEQGLKWQQRTFCCRCSGNVPNEILLTLTTDKSSN